MTKCPYCGRNLRENERYCDFCELDISKTADEAEKPDVKSPDLKKEIEKVKSFPKTIINIFNNIKKKLKREE